MSYDGMIQGGAAGTKRTATNQLKVGIKTSDVLPAAKVWWTGLLDLTNTYTCNAPLDTGNLQFVAGATCQQVGGTGSANCIIGGTFNTLSCSIGGNAVDFGLESITILGDVGSTTTGATTTTPATT
eukprot:TRINITY_DN301_c0_g1_i1.p1 TRINITY_DN301_c0_g1~~TRINITY_DN301_c0_g1_i1.p1  ORF type:complete len:126 (-),score=29.45 TRINITY_DN301_c0_g1_i1:61-438(-)